MFKCGVNVNVIDGRNPAASGLAKHTLDHRLAIATQCCLYLSQSKVRPQKTLLPRTDDKLCTILTPATIPLPALSCGYTR